MKKVKAEYHNEIGLDHQKSMVFDDIKPHLLIKSYSHKPMHMPQAVEPPHELRRNKFIKLKSERQYNVIIN